MKLLQCFNLDLTCHSILKKSAKNFFLYYNAFCYNYDVISIVDFPAFDTTAKNKSLVATPWMKFLKKIKGKY